MKKIAELFREIVPASKVTEGADMARLVTFRAGGRAEILVEPENPQQLQKVLEIINREKIDYFVMGNGSNLLVKDGGYPGVIIKISGQAFKSVDVEPDGISVRVGGGVLMGSFAGFLKKNGLSGFEFAAGIPGTIGGAVFMNAGAYGGEIKDVLVSAKLLSRNGEKVFELSGDELELTYRHSILHDTGDIVLEALFKFEKGDPEKIQEKMDENNASRRAKQPLNYPNAGSTFKRPDGYIAAKLIQDAGLKGFSVGNAQVSELHSGFVVNKGGASASDILEVMSHCKEVVKAEFGVVLEPEVQILGVD